MINSHTFENLTWTDLHDPTTDEIREVAKNRKIDPSIAEDLTTPTHKSQANAAGDHIYIVLHIPAVRHSHQDDTKQEIDFVITEDDLITVRYDEIDPIHKFAKEFDAEAVMGRTDIGNHGAYIFYHLVQKLYKSIEHELEYIEAELDDIEQKIFSGNEKKMVAKISQVSRQLLDIERVFFEQADTLAATKTMAGHLFNADTQPLFERLISMHKNMHERINWHQQIIKELRDTNTSLVRTKQNEVVKSLTLMAFFTFPLALIASLFGMNTIATPVVGTPYDFWIILAAMIILTLIFFGYFQYKDWI